MLTYQGFLTLSYGKCVALFTKCCISHCLKHEYSFWGACYSQVYFTPLLLPSTQKCSKLQGSFLPFHGTAQLFEVLNIKTDTTSHESELNEVKWHQWALYFLRIQSFQCHFYTYVYVCKCLHSLHFSFVSLGWIKLCCYCDQY